MTVDVNFINKYLLSIIDSEPNEAVALYKLIRLEKHFMETDLIIKLESLISK